MFKNDASNGRSRITSNDQVTDNRPAVACGLFKGAGARQQRDRFAAAVQAEKADMGALLGRPGPQIIVSKNNDLQDRKVIERYALKRLIRVIPSTSLCTNEVLLLIGSLMNARINTVANHHGTWPADDEIRQSLQLLLASAAFAKAPRMRHLLSFLMEKKLSGMEHQICEYAIGLEVFRRDARDYDTTIDPVVRVQIGRLRSRLSGYYTALDHVPALQIGIPTGSYSPLVTWAAADAPPLRPGKLQLAPLRNLMQEPAANAFVYGVEEELGARLFQAFGGAVEFLATSCDVPSNVGNHCLAHRLDVCVRTEHRRARVSMRLLNVTTGQVAMLAQLDRHGDLGIGLQEELAMAICAEVQRHFALACAVPSQAVETGPAGTARRERCHQPSVPCQ